MDLNQVKKLVKLVESSQIDELEIQDEGIRIRVTKSRAGHVLAPAMAQSAVHAPVSAVSAPQPPVAAGPAESVPAPSDKLVEIRSPMVGTFYRAPAPDAPPYVREGDLIQPQKILCIIEAMKLMNEIEAEISGRVVKILAENAQAVEYNQPLFLVEKT